METRTLRSTGASVVDPGEHPPPDIAAGGWQWIDVHVAEDDSAALMDLTAELGFDSLAVRDATDDLDLPKVDDFHDHLLVVLHGLRWDSVETYEVDCFLTEATLVTVHRERSPAIDALWDQLRANPQLGSGGVDELLARLADVLTRRFVSVLDAFDNEVDTLMAKALSADPGLLPDLTAVRSDLGRVRRISYPQREALDQLRHGTSHLLSDASRRRFSDVFDVAIWVSQGMDASRGALAEILGAYQAAEARRATDVTRVLTIYAAIILPLSLVAGFYGMNFSNLPGLGDRWGWVAATAVMIVIAAVSIGIFVAQGWIKRPSGREAGATLGRGLIEASRTPVQVVGAVYELSTMPIRATGGRRVNTGKPRTEDTP